MAKPGKTLYVHKEIYDQIVTLLNEGETWSNFANNALKEKITLRRNQREAAANQH